MLSKNLLRSVLWVLVGAVMVAGLSDCLLLAQTQSFTATLSGSITDPSGATLPGAKVTLTSPERGITRTFTTDETGLYTFTMLPPAEYNLTVEAAAYKTYKQAGITLAAGQSAQQKITLTIGGQKEVITVEANAPLLNVDNANVSADITQRQVVELPLNLRNVYSLSLLNSSVNDSSEGQVVKGNGTAGVADQDVSFLNFGGTMFGTAAMLLDGTWDTGADWGGVVYVPAVDGVQEFKIQTNAFTSQYGWSSGNVVNVVTKSGTNEYHGNAWEFYRNSAMDAQFRFSDRKADFNRHQYGASIGGPLVIPGVYNGKGKTYFFAYYEGNRSSTPANATFNVPTDAWRGGDFSSLLGSAIGTDYVGRTILAGAIYDPFTTRAVTEGQIDPVTGQVVHIRRPNGDPIVDGNGNPVTTGYLRDPFDGNIIDPLRFDAVAKNLLPYWPEANVTGQSYNYSQAASAPFHSDEYSIRIDHNFTDNTRLNGRFSKKYETKTNVPAYYGSDNPGGPGAVNPNNRWSFNLGLNHVFTPTFVMSLNFGLNRWIEQSHAQAYGFQPSTIGLPSFVDQIAPIFPLVTLQGGIAPLGPGGGNGLDEYAVPRNDGTGSVDFTKSNGKHTFSFGFTEIVNQLNGGHVANNNLTFPSINTGGPDPQSAAAAGSSFAAFLLGYGGGYAGAPGPGTGINAMPATSKKYLGWYLQDDWKVTPKFTLNLGLRYEIQTAPIERNNHQVYFDPDADNPLSSEVGLPLKGALIYNTGSNRSLYNTAYQNIAPRIGVAYQLTNNLTFRGGYGVFFIPSYPGNGPTNGYSQNTPWVTSAADGFTPLNLMANAFPNGAIAPVGSANGMMQDVGQGTNAVFPNRKAPYVQQWMGGFQYSLGANDLIDLTYVGNHGVHMLTNMQRNQIPDEDLSMGSALSELVPNPFYGTITASACNLANPTVPRGQLLRPFPQYCGILEQNAPAGDSSYNALQASYTHRWKSGLSIMTSYTWSKFIDNVAGSAGWAFAGASGTRNFNNLALDRSVDGNDIPHSLVVNYIYELPFGKGKAFGGSMSSLMNGIVGGWQLSGVTSLKSGFPLSVTCNDNSNSLGGGTGRCNLIGDPKPANQTIDHWINYDAFAPADPYTFGNAPRYFSKLRAPGYQNWDLAVQKYWEFGREGMRMQFRAEMFNAFNHPNLYAPNQNWTGGTATFGRITNSLQPRDVQLGLKFYW